MEVLKVYKGEIREKYNEHDRVVYEIAFEKGLYHLRDEIIMYKSELNLTYEQNIKFAQYLDSCVSACERMLYEGLDIDQDL